MKTQNRIVLVVVLFLAPILVRAVTFYQNPFYKAQVARPDFASFKLPEPPTPSSRPTLAAAPPGTGKIVLVDAYHDNLYSPDEIEPFVTALSARGGRVEFDQGLQPLADQLKYTSAYIIFSPSLAFSEADLLAVRHFVNSGGRLLVFADPTRSLSMYDMYNDAVLVVPDVNYVNPVLAPYGLSFTSDYLYNLQDNEGNFRNVKFVDFAESPLTAGLKMVVFYGVHPIQTNTGSPLIRSDKNTFSSLTDQRGTYIPLALSANGLALAVGDFSFLTNPFSQVADNEMLLNAIADFALDGERVPLLSNFPYLFTRPTSLVTVGEVQLDASLLRPIAWLQNVLGLVNIPLNMRTKAVEGNDVIVLGTFTNEEAIAVYTKMFGITFDQTENSIEIKGMGRVSAKDSGLLLFGQGPLANTLVLLAPTVKMLPELVELVASGDIDACVLQENVGVCSLLPIDDEDSQYNDMYFDYDYDYDYAYSDEVTSTPVP